MADSTARSLPSSADPAGRPDTILLAARRRAILGIDLDPRGWTQLSARMAQEMWRATPAPAPKG